jgi:hypothetical protein
VTAVRVRVGPGDDLAALVRAAEGESVLVLIDAGLDPLTMAQVRAGVGPLAVERAPLSRVNALVLSAEADPADVEAAALFLEVARSTTGQVLEVGARI